MSDMNELPPFDDFEPIAGGGTAFINIFDVMGREPRVVVTIPEGETPREYNERLYPDLMMRIDRLYERTLMAEIIPTGRSRAADVFANRFINEVGERQGGYTLVPVGDEWEEIEVGEEPMGYILGDDATDEAFRRSVYGYRSSKTGAEVYAVVNHDSQLLLCAEGHVLHCSDARIRKGWWCYQ